MTIHEKQETRRVPPAIVVMSIGSVVVPVALSFLTPPGSFTWVAPLWLLPIIPVLIGGYRGGWRGALPAIVGVSILLVVSQIALVNSDRAGSEFLPAVAGVFLVLAGTGVWLSELLHRERDVVEDMAFTDPLTKLPNRRHAAIFLENEFAAAERGRTLTVVLFDLDAFKDYNDRHGHAAGDAALSAFGEILEKSTRRMNLSARFGGEEFLSILAGSDSGGAMIFADRVRSALKERDLPGGKLTVSAGVASYQAGMEKPDELLAAADHALYRAKREGRDRIRLFGHIGDSEERPELRGSESGRVELPKSVGRAHEDPAAAALEALVAPQPESMRREPPNDPAIPALTSAGVPASRRILVVDDDPESRSLIAGYLNREGCVVSEAADVGSTLDEIRTEFDVVITDIRLPDGNGTQVVSAVKSRWPATQVIVVTGMRDAETAAEALNAGADRYILKPFGIVELQGHLNDAFERRRRILWEQEEIQLLSTKAYDRARQAREAVTSGLRGLALAVEVRDPYIRGHSKRVAEYSLKIAEVIDPHETALPRESLALGCELHDIGKIGIPDAILNKVSHLSEDEIEEMRQHPNAGRRLLENVVDDPVLLDVVSGHHEWWNGMGYPNQLLGDEIPLSARIVGVADSLDAMTTNRAYRKALTWDRAVDQIIGLRGSQFDPAVVDAFLACMPKLRQLYDRAGVGTAGAAVV